MQTQPTASVVVTEYYGRTVDLSQFAEEHRPAIAEAIIYAEHAGIFAEPFRYLPNDALSPGGNGHVLVAFRERHDVEVTPSTDRWFSVLDIDTRTSYPHDRLLQAWRDARGWTGS